MTGRPREMRNGSGLSVIETALVPEATAVPVGRRVVFDGGVTGIHEGGGVVRIYGEGEHYGYVGHCARCSSPGTAVAWQ